MAVSTVRFTAKSSDFKGLSLKDDDDDAKGFGVDFRRMPALFFSDAADIVRPGRRCNVVIMRRPSHEQITDSSADDIRFKPGLIQCHKQFMRSIFLPTGPLSLRN